MKDSRKIVSEIWNTKIPRKDEYEKNLDIFEEKIKEYARQQCKAQNKICFTFICRALIEGVIPSELLGKWIETMYQKAPLPAAIRKKKKIKK
tara:strand:+ start:288 stop:563 length:276 start_codon:yes stop_codon:yes gene_type:complete